MKKFLLLNLGFIFCSAVNAQPTKKVAITGAVVAPWVKGNLCMSYWYEQNKIRECHDIHAGKDYIFSNIPNRVGHIKIARSFNKECKLKKNGKKKCRTVKGKFKVNKPLTKLNLTYDHNGIYKYYTIPPKEAESIYGYPRKDPSLHFRKAAISDPTAFS